LPFRCAVIANLTGENREAEEAKEEEEERQHQSPL